MMKHSKLSMDQQKTHPDRTTIKKDNLINYPKGSQEIKSLITGIECFLPSGLT